MLLLDTHVFIWLASDLSKLTPSVKEALRKTPDQLFVSSISALEISLLVKRKRLTLPTDSFDFFQSTLEQHGLKEFPIDGEIASQSASLPPIHNDPFDRIILATAKIHKMTVLSKDQNFPQYKGIKILWEK